ncbi:MAG: DUF445 domain-containing protein [Archaeoglobaceae archaeon]
MKIKFAMDYLIYFIPPILGCFIGYVTNVVAVKMLFYPKKPVNILGLKIQGLVPARSKELSERIMDTLSELLTKDDLEYIIDRAIARTYIESRIRKKVDEVLENTVLSVFSKTIKKGYVVDRISSSIAKYVENFTKDAVSKNLVNNIDIRELVAKKAAEISDEEIEEIFLKFAARELRFIEISGAVLGLIIGSFQSLIFWTLG